MGHNLSILSMSEFFETGCLLDQCREVTDWSLTFGGSGGVNSIRRGPQSPWKWEELHGFSLQLLISSFRSLSLRWMPPFIAPIHGNSKSENDWVFAHFSFALINGIFD